VFDRVEHTRLIVISGKGGVGRTTIAALCGLELARRGKRVLVATTGLDARLAWMLGADHLEDHPTEVGRRLFVQRLVPQTCVREYGTIVMRSKMLSTAVFDNKAIRRFLRAIPGLDDFSVLGKAWHEAVRGDTFDTVVFDGPASGHLLFTLSVPDAILQAVNRGPLIKEAQAMRKSLQRPDHVQALLVGLPELWPLTELSELGGELTTRIRTNVAGIVVNGIWPAHLPMFDVPAGSQVDATTRYALTRLSTVARMSRRQHEEVDRWRTSGAARACGTDAIAIVPWRFEGVSTMADLDRLWQSLDETRQEPES
jgi:hypothetical protein